jgi:isoprenylcysteine carboxyl methyltransferase (ICMT) family protein YpbQ
MRLWADPAGERARLFDVREALPANAWGSRCGREVSAMNAVAFTSVVWAVFWICWLAASVAVKAGQRRWAVYAGVRLAIVVAVIGLLRGHWLAGHVITRDPWLQGVGLAVFVLGLALAVWARVYIGRNWGMPMSRKVDPELVTTGPYRAIRHPIYSGILLGMVGTAVAVGSSWLVVALVLGVYFVYSAVMEERYMAERFPGTYPAYKRSTKMLIPFVF